MSHSSITSTLAIGNPFQIAYTSSSPFAFLEIQDLLFGNCFIFSLRPTSPSGPVHICFVYLFLEPSASILSMCSNLFRILWSSRLDKLLLYPFLSLWSLFLFLSLMFTLRTLLSCTIYQMSSLSFSYCSILYHVTTPFITRPPPLSQFLCLQMDQNRQRVRSEIAFPFYLLM